MLKQIGREHLVVQLVGEQYFEGEHAHHEQSEVDGVGALLALLCVHLLILTHCALIVPRRDHGQYDHVKEYDKCDAH